MQIYKIQILTLQQTFGHICTYPDAPTILHSKAIVNINEPSISIPRSISISIPTSSAKTPSIRLLLSMNHQYRYPDQYQYQYQHLSLKLKHQYSHTNIAKATRNVNYHDPLPIFIRSISVDSYKCNDLDFDPVEMCQCSVYCALHLVYCTMCTLCCTLCIVTFERGIYTD